MTAFTTPLNIVRIETKSVDLPSFAIGRDMNGSPWGLILNDDQYMDAMHSLASPEHPLMVSTDELVHLALLAQLDARRDVTHYPRKEA